MYWGGKHRIAERRTFANAVILTFLLMAMIAVVAVAHDVWPGQYVLRADTPCPSASTTSPSPTPTPTVSSSSPFPSASLSASVPSSSASVSSPVPSSTPATCATSPASASASVSVSVSPSMSGSASASPSTSGSASASPSTTAAVPAAPTNVIAAAGASAIKVSWTAPAVTTGVTVTGYQATASPGPATCTTDAATTTSCIVGAQAGVTYTLTVVALSAGGRSAASDASNAATPTSPVLATEPPDTDLPLVTGDGAISTAAPGQDLVMIGDGYAPYSTVTIAVYSSPVVLATATADEDGAFEQPVTVPASLSIGSHSFVAAGVAPDGAVHALRLDVTIAEAGDDAGLPVTGPAIFWLMVSGFTATLLGIALRSVRRHPALPAPPAAHRHSARHRR